MELKHVRAILESNICTNDGDCFYDCDTCNKARKTLREYADAEEQGLLIKLPYKSGDTIYDIHFGNTLKCKVSGYECDADGRWFMKTQYGRIPMDELHETYPSREEAEQALKGGRP
ncbi:MAG: hypothetical protein K0R34_3295 [Herbinix sp.]|jgi:hypothetical protein|nr:hypothetical protein [Herbinix sp.]